MSEASTLEATHREAVRSAILAAAVTPRKRTELVAAAKGSVTAKKDKEKKAAVETIIDEMITAGELHKHGASAKSPLSKEKPFNPNDPEKVNAALLEAAATPQTKAHLVNTVVTATNATPKFVETQVKKLIESQQLHKHGTGKEAPFGKDKPFNPNDPEKVNAALLEAAATPQAKAHLVDAAVTATKATPKFVETQVKKLLEAQQLHNHGTGKTAKLGKNNPNDLEKVRTALLDAAATPQAMAKLVAAAINATNASKTFVTEQANQLIAAEQLHKHGTGEKAPYARDKPPHALEIAPGKKAFAALVKAAKKVSEVAPDVPFDEVVQRLRSALTNEVAKPDDPSPALPPPVTPIAPLKPPVPPEITPERIRTGLKAAYDELCLFPEFEDKLVEIRRLYHATVGLLPGLTVPQFHRELEHLQSQRQIELQPINEVQRAQEPHLAIPRQDRLLYFAIWR